jgi:hypothetical protein
MSAPRQSPLSIACAASSKSWRVGHESASMKTSQSPCACAAPALRAIAAVRSVELLSQAIARAASPR